jgi:hypothetical protein
VEPHWAKFLKGIRKESKAVKPMPGFAVAAVAAAAVNRLSLGCHTYGFILNTIAPL